MNGGEGGGDSSALIGSLLGQALGDALGFVVEAEPPESAREYVDGWLRTGRAQDRSHPGFPFGQYTDDTQLARELLRSFLDAGEWSPAAFAIRVAELFHDGRVVGAGRGTRSAAVRLLTGVPWQQSGTPAPYAGNGSAMRAGPLGILIPECGAMCRAAGEQSRITHLDPRCAAGSIAIAGAVALAARRKPIEPRAFLAELARWAGAEDGSVGEAIERLTDWVSLEPGAAARHIHDAGLDPDHMTRWQGISAFVTPSVLWSLYAFLRSPDDYWETICTAIEVGGDTDTMAAMAGAISGARLGPEGLPRTLVDCVNDRGKWDAPALARLAQDAAAVLERD
ncbi:MAG: ADP-ribosylglycohydrolase family protein [Gemmatimonadales bacterium]